MVHIDENTDDIIVDKNGDFVDVVALNREYYHNNAKRLFAR